MWLVESYATDHFARPVKSKNPGFGVLQGPSLAYTKVVQCVQLQRYRRQAGSTNYKVQVFSYTCLKYPYNSSFWSLLSRSEVLLLILAAARWKRSSRSSSELASIVCVKWGKPCKLTPFTHPDTTLEPASPR